MSSKNNYFSFIFLLFICLGLNAQTSKDQGFSSEDYVWMGDKACDEENWVDGISNYNKAINLDSSNSIAYTQLSRAYYHIDKFDESYTAASKAIQIDSSNVKAHEYLAVLYGQKDDFKNAEKHLLKMIELDDQSGEGYYGIAKIRTVEEDFEAALIYANQALKLYEKDQAAETGDVQYLVGILNYYNGDESKAREYFSYAKLNNVEWDPEVIKFMSKVPTSLITPQDFYSSQEVFLEGVEYLTKNKVVKGDKKRLEYAQFILEWVSGAPHVSLAVTQKVVPYMTYGESFIIYLGTGAKYKIENPDNEEWKAGLIATEKVIDHYKLNKKHYGKNKEIEKLMKMQRKNRLAIFIEENYR